MIVLGLTGGIGMGKSVAAALLRRLRLPVHDADQVVHELLGPGGAAVAAVAAMFPGVVSDAGIDRRKLAARVFGDPAALARLEAALHPRVRESQARFLARQRRRRAPLVVLDIPLLYETGADRRVDRVILVSAPSWMQRRRVLARAGASEATLSAILARQWPDARKRRRASYVVASSLGRAYTSRKLKAIVGLERGRRCAK